MEKWILCGKHEAHQNGLKKNEKCMMKHNEFHINHIRLSYSTGECIIAEQ